jgi:anaerobic ribonucleoside-triphosphate reductase activating protein
LRIPAVSARDEPVLHVAQLIPGTESEGPGRRFAVWVQGCPLRCPGCCNPEMLPFAGGEARAVNELAAQVIGAAGIEGLTLLGGEPVAQVAACAALASAVRDAGLSVMVFSGYTLEELRDRAVDDVDVARLLSCCDLLVDGRYRSDLPEPRRRWIGSANQRLWFLSDRYRADDPRFAAPNTIELRLSRDGLLLSGWPAALRGLARFRQVRG